jgi:hypothetical protein
LVAASRETDRPVVAVTADPDLWAAALETEVAVDSEVIVITRKEETAEEEASEALVVAEMTREAVEEVADLKVETEVVDVVAKEVQQLRTSSIVSLTSIGRRAASRILVRHFHHITKYLTFAILIAQQDLDRELEEYQKKAQADAAI